LVDGRWNCSCNPEEARKSTNHTSQFLEANHISDSGYSILTEITDKTFQTGSKGLWNFRISPRLVQSLSHVRIFFSYQSRERSIKSGAMRVI
jgi:hypothetical protein